MCKTLGWVIAIAAAIIISGESRAAVIYSAIGSTYSQAFDGFPSDIPGNDSNIQANANYADGWQDDVDPTVSAEKDISVPGWYLWHPVSPTTGTPAENGFNDRQRVRNGQGANTGAFWLYGNTAANTEKALGSLGSTTVAGNGAEMYIALRLTNNTGSTLDQITVKYDGEEWRDGQGTSGETFVFGYNVGATTANGPVTPDWASTAVYTLVPQLNFTAPTVAGTGTAGTAVDGNAAANRVAGITMTVNGVNWQPGTDLWLRWADPQIASLADDGLAIDNFSFSAQLPEPSAVVLALVASIGLCFRGRGK